MSPTAVTGLIMGLVLAVIAVWILRPLQLPLHRMTTPDDDRWRELIENKHQLYRSILDLEFDASVGKVSDDDYLVLRRQQEGEALAVLTELDEIAATRERPTGVGAAARNGVLAAGRPGGAGGPAGAAALRLEDRLEAEIAAARQRLHPQSPRADS